MEGWKKYDGCKVFLRTRLDRTYSGIVIEVDESSIPIFLTILDKYNKKVTFATSEIIEIKEEG
jgi:hypothetical protein